MTHIRDSLTLTLFQRQRERRQVLSLRHGRDTLRHWFRL
jgi:hypothetical protein